MAEKRVALTDGNYQALRIASERGQKSMVVLANEILESILNKQGALLHIPSELTKGNKDGLEQWLHARANMLVKHFYP